MDKSDGALIISILTIIWTIYRDHRLRKEKEDESKEKVQVRLALVTPPARDGGDPRLTLNVLNTGQIEARIKEVSLSWTDPANNPSKLLFGFDGDRLESGLTELLHSIALGVRDARGFYLRTPTKDELSDPVDIALQSIATNTVPALAINVETHCGIIASIRSKELGRMIIQVYKAIIDREKKEAYYRTKPDGA